MEGTKPVSTDHKKDDKRGFVHRKNADGSHRPSGPRGRPAHDRNSGSSFKRPRPASGPPHHQRPFGNKHFKKNDGKPRREAPQKVAKPRKEVVNTFTAFRAALDTPEQIALYLRENHTKTLTDPKKLQNLLQSLCNRDTALYEELMSKWKAEVALLLEYVFSLYSLKKAKMPPSAHEFVIRCEQQGVRKSGWATDMAPLEGVQPSLLTPKQLLQKLIALDRLGRVQRLIELCHTVQDLVSCVRKIGKLFTPAEPGADEETEDDIPYAVKCQLISKLISKARRIVTVPNPKKGKGRSFAKKSPQVADDKETPAPAEAEDGKEEEEADPTTVEASTTAEAAATVEEGEAEEDNEDEKETKGAKIVDLSDEDKEAFRDMVRQTFQLLETVLAARPSHTTQQPLTKFIHFSKWCLDHHLIEEDAAEVLSKFEDEAQTAMGEQAEQLEVVMKLRGLPAGDEPALRELLNEMWASGKEKSFFPHSADVLSCVATAAAASGMSEELREETAGRLTKTHAVLKKNGAELPRRALRLVNEVASKKKHEAIKLQLEEENKKQGH